MNRTLAVIAAVVALGVGLSACETPTPYQPLSTHNATSGGFTDQRLDANHFRVTFEGNSMTSRQRVENYLLYRAAELTAGQGYDWFEMVMRDTTNHQSSYVDPAFGFYGGWSPYWRYHGGWGWRSWDPFWGDPFWADSYDIHTIDRYEANAEIAMGHGPKPARAFDAREVMQNLGPSIVKPS
ncbi:MAG: hypothetical protein JO127_00230 [Caulobacteraceae bacterium]|nr:hypothetical protein [Caulobacteraceae bacterium]